MAGDLEQVSILADDPLMQIAFAVYENKGVFAVLLGSCMSRGAGAQATVTFDQDGKPIISLISDNKLTWQAP